MNLRYDNTPDNASIALMTAVQFADLGLDTVDPAILQKRTWVDDLSKGVSREVMEFALPSATFAGNLYFIDKYFSLHCADVQDNTIKHSQALCFSVLMSAIQGGQYDIIFYLTVMMSEGIELLEVPQLKKMLTAINIIKADDYILGMKIQNCLAEESLNFTFVVTGHESEQNRLTPSSEMIEIDSSFARELAFALCDEDSELKTAARSPILSPPNVGTHKPNPLRFQFGGWSPRSSFYALTCADEFDETEEKYADEDTLELKHWLYETPKTTKEVVSRTELATRLGLKINESPPSSPVNKCKLPRFFKFTSDEIRDKFKPNSYHYSVHWTAFKKSEATLHSAAELSEHLLKSGMKVS